MAIGGALGFWYRTVMKFPSKVGLFHFTLAIICLLLGLTSDVETVKVVYTAFACVFILISAVYLMMKDTEKSTEDVEVWTTVLAVLMWITGVLTLAMDYPNTRSGLDPLVIGMAASFFAYVFRKRGNRNGRKEENL